MKKIAIILSVLAMCTAAEASWYWPFGGSKSKAKTRVSELIAPASDLIDDAADKADKGELAEAVETYRKALDELDRVEAENADRAQSASFATLRNKRAYVKAAIDALLLRQAHQNARAVAVTDTTELERKYAELKGAKPESGEAGAENPGDVEQGGRNNTQVVMQDGKPVHALKLDAASAERRAKIEEAYRKSPKSRRVRLLLAAEDIRSGSLQEALALIEEILGENPNDASALNLRAAAEMDMGDADKAEATLDQAIMNNPKSHFAYYNMARLILKTRGDGGRDMAREYYEAGRKCGGPEDRALEGQF